MVVPRSTARVLTTASFAVKPESSAVAARQSPKPAGASTGLMKRPIHASILSELDSTTLNRASNVCRNQIIKVPTKITVNAFCKKSLAFSHKEAERFSGTEDGSSAIP